MRNIVYVSGSHGSGKSTLIKKIAEKDPELFIVHKKLRIPKSKDSFERQKLRIIRYYWDAVKQHKFSEDSPNKILLCDRCALSSYVYPRSFLQLGWLTQKQYDDCVTLREGLFDEDIKSENIIFLNPSLEELKCNIKKRWKETGKKKWKEDNFEYLEAIKNDFEKLYSNQKVNVLEIDFLDLEKRVHTCYDWIEKTIKGAYL